MEHTTSSESLDPRPPISIGMDIGGTFAKFVLFENDKPSSQATHLHKQHTRHPLETVIRKLTQTDTKDALPRGWISETLHFEAGAECGSVVLQMLAIPVLELDRFVAKVEAIATDSTGSARKSMRQRIAATGGGALKRKDELETRFGVDIVVVHEHQSLVRGWRQQLDTGGGCVEQQAALALLCNVGTGVSIVHVTGTDAPGFERVSGSGIGASTLWSLIRRMTSFDNFEQAVVASASSGDAQKADILVGDIYGVETSKAIGMPPDLVAGFLGKINDDSELSDADVAAALVRMFASNLGQLAVFQARLLELDTVWFTGGCFGSVGGTDDSTQGQACLVVRKAVGQAVEFWSAGKITVRFPSSAPFLGAAGAVLEAAAAGGTGSPV
ncbi:hypothetical protein H4217_004625 [Coemansia sp. RSA 1939]|nr:hypothetical protein H4217_004625 [Coemansia sp. RSA 1939]KAJ2604675.1 hypothetical protein EV177_006344 [Coemansia sp. RSA 1804]KAJ2693582.1 hypothetical protein GGH99_001093 [Coemansia sp. RSA 1285]